MCQNAQGGHHHHAAGKPHVHPHTHPHPTRRDLLRLGAGGMAAALGGKGRLIAGAPDGGHGPGETATGRPFKIEPVARGVYAAIAQPAPMLNCNAAIVVSDDHVLIVDTHSRPSAARALIGQIRAELTQKPIKYVVDSHFHDDHARGNAEYPSAFGHDVEIVASNATRDLLVKMGESRAKGSIEGASRDIARLKAELAKATDAGDKARLGSQIKGLEEYVAEMSPPRITLPTLTFDRRMVIHRDGREIHLLFLGRAHTAGDVVVYLPDARAIATGDLMHGLLPYMGDGFPDEWPATLKALSELEFDRVIPGHGAVQRGKSVLAAFRSYVEEINEAVARGVERGDTLDALKSTILARVPKSLEATGQVERLGREYTALDMNGPSNDPAATVRSSIESNVREVFEYYTRRKGGKP